MTDSTYRFQITHCNEVLDIDEEANYLVCDLEPGHHGDHHATGTEATHPHRTYAVTWTPAPDVVPGKVITPAPTPTGPVIICEPRTDCADPHPHRWHCMRGHDGAEPGVCPLTVCDRRGANR